MRRRGRYHSITDFAGSTGSILPGETAQVQTDTMTESISSVIPLFSAASVATLAGEECRLKT